MKSEMMNSTGVVNALEGLRQELSRLSERVAALEAAAAVKLRPAPPVPSPAPEPQPESLSEELVLVISAAIAAFLGKKPRIRQISLLSSANWAQQGRVTIQASHVLPIQHS